MKRRDIRKPWVVSIDLKKMRSQVGVLALLSLWVLSLAFAVTIPYWRSNVDVMVMTDAVIDPVYKGSPDKPLMSFGVNVDWGEDILPEMLQIFKEHNIFVTFFVTGRWAGLHGDTLKQMAAAGHEIANHGYKHDHPFNLGEWDLTMHILENQKLLQDIVGNPAMLYAPPYGEVDRRIAQTAKGLGFRTIMWTIDTIDWQEPSVQTTVSRVVDKAENGAIVLMHPKPNTAKALPIMIEGLKKQGFQLVPVGKLLEG